MKSLRRCEMTMRIAHSAERTTEPLDRPLIGDAAPRAVRRLARI